MADDKQDDKPKKTYEDHTIIARVKQIQDEGKTLALKLEESDGSSWGWKSFHPSEYRNKVDFDEVYKFDVAKVHEEGRQYPWRNLKKLHGPAEMPASGEMTSRAKETTGGGAPPRANGGGGGRTMDQTVVTRNSIEAGNAVNMVLELMKLGIQPNDMTAAIEELTANADVLIDWMSSHWVELTSPMPAASTNGASQPAAKSGGGNAAKAVENPTNLGDLLNTCMANWALTRKDVERITEMDGAEITDFGEALKRVGFEMTKGEPEPATAA